MPSFNVNKLFVAFTVFSCVFYLIYASHEKISLGIARRRLPIQINRHHLLRLKLTGKFEYRQQLFYPRPNPALVRAQGSVFDVEGVLRTPPTVHNATSLLDTDYAKHMPTCQELMTVAVPLTTADDTNHSKLMLGASTRLDRLMRALPEWASYLAGSGIHIAVILQDEFDPKSAAVQRARRMARSLNIDMSLICEGELLPKDTMSPTGFWPGHSNFEVLLAFMKFRKGTTDWFGIVDDDTFINSIPDLVRTLGKFDASQPYYCGATTESKAILAEYGYYAWGGAGIFLSRPLLEDLATNFTTCVELDMFGDKIWARCIWEISPPINLTEIVGLHQLDFHDPMAGWYESGTWPLLTVHHWRSWHKAPVPKAHLVTSLAGTDSFLARFVSREHNVVLTNGYSLVYYPLGIPDLSRQEATWGGDEDPAQLEQEWLQVGSLRPPVPGEQKISWYIEDAVREGNMVRQYYVRRGDVDSVIELDWIH